MTCLFFAWDSRLSLNNSYAVAEDSVLNIHRVCLFTSSSLLRTDSVQHAIQNRNMTLNITTDWKTLLFENSNHIRSLRVLKRAQISLEFTLFPLHTLRNTLWRIESLSPPPGSWPPHLNVDLPLNFLINKMAEMTDKSFWLGNTPFFSL